MSGILSLMCTWIYSIITTDKQAEILHKVSNLNKLLPEKQSWLSLIFHIPVGDDVSPQHSLHTSFKCPLLLSGSCQSSPASPFQPFPGPCPHHWTTTASCPWHSPCGSQNIFYDCTVLHFLGKLELNYTHTNWKAEVLWKTVGILLLKVGRTSVSLYFNISPPQSTMTATSERVCGIMAPCTSKILLQIN